MAPGDTENSYHDGDEAFEVDADYSYSVEMPEDSSYSDDHDGLSPRVDESRGRDDESRGRTMGEDDGEEMVGRQALDGKSSGRQALEGLV